MKFDKDCLSQHNHSFAQINSKQVNFQEEQIKKAQSIAKFDYVFNIVPKSTPTIIRKCARCNENRFASSDKFRINANKKMIDVWLIFKCTHCDYTLNLEILSRKSVATIDKDLLERFHVNDKMLAWQYAFDPSYIERGMTVDWAIDFDVNPKVEISYENDLKHHKTVSILIKSDFFLKLSVSIVLRKILSVSRSYLDKMQMLRKIEIKNLQEKPIALKNLLGFGCNIYLF